MIDMMHSKIAQGIFPIALILIVFSSACVTNPTQKYYAGDVRNFRADLVIAERTPVYPNEDALAKLLLREDIVRIWIAYYPEEQKDAYYAVASFELANKLVIIHRAHFGSYPRIELAPVNTSADIDRFRAPAEPLILLLGEGRANKTAVTVGDNIVYVEGESFKEVGRKYTDLDLAVDKLLLALMKEDFNTS